MVCQGYVIRIIYLKISHSSWIEMKEKNLNFAILWSVRVQKSHVLEYRLGFFSGNQKLMFTQMLI